MKPFQVALFSIVLYCASSNDPHRFRNSWYGVRVNKRINVEAANESPALIRIRNPISDRGWIENSGNLEIYPHSSTSWQQKDNNNVQEYRIPSNQQTEAVHFREPNKHEDKARQQEEDRARWVLPHAKLLYPGSPGFRSADSSIHFSPSFPNNTLLEHQVSSQQIEVLLPGNYLENVASVQREEIRDTTGRIVQRVNSGTCEVSLACGATSLKVTVESTRPFNGRIYSQTAESELQCHTLGVGLLVTSLTIPYMDPHCGVRNLRNGTLMVEIVVQRHPQIMMKEDVAYKLFCNFNTEDVVITNSIMLMGNIATSWISGIAPTPEVRLRITNKDGKDVTSAKMGDELLLIAEMLDESLFGIFITDLVAYSSTETSHITLLDRKGCITEPTVLSQEPNISSPKEVRNKFEAFKFPKDPIVKFRATVHFCLDQCEPANCLPDNRLTYRRKKRQVNSAGELPTDLPLQTVLIISDLDETRGVGDAAAVTSPPEDCFTRLHLVLFAVGALALQLITIAVCIIHVCFLRKRHLNTCRRSLDNTSFNSSITGSFVYDEFQKKNNGGR
ncbi:uncharacterized protein LOC143253545 [Tachypleus tridentatus]|uniref:uncharacterized protein LOC143253545 n=1 Tax=Tachypleus tridentatus TaxID=6853 RepID=UPI003FD4C6D6